MSQTPCEGSGIERKETENKICTHPAVLLSEHVKAACTSFKASEAKDSRGTSQCSFNISICTSRRETSHRALCVLPSEHSTGQAHSYGTEHSPPTHTQNFITADMQWEWNGAARTAGPDHVTQMSLTLEGWKRTKGSSCVHRKWKRGFHWPWIKDILQRKLFKSTFCLHQAISSAQYYIQVHPYGTSVLFQVAEQ